MAEKAETNGKRFSEVVLGGETYQVNALAMGPARQWRHEFAEPVQQVLGLLENADTIELNNTADMVAVAQQVLPLVLSSMDLLVDALFAYAPVLAAEREQIEAVADDEEALAALWTVIKLAYPFGSLAGFLNGAGLIGTSKS